MEPDEISSMLGDIITTKNIRNVVPVISNSFRLDQIFGSERKEIPELMDDGFTIKELLTMRWADQIHYPMPDSYKLWRVAQYYQVKKAGTNKAKEEYLTFLKNRVLDINEKKEGYEDLIPGYRKDARRMSFSDMVKGLGYFVDPDQVPDPLFTLAKLPFPVYITTSHHDFLERAIEQASGGLIKPRTQVIFWEPGVMYDDASEANHEPDPNFSPTPKEPAIYHLFGLENYPGSLVLSEDDYIRYLIAVVSDRDPEKPIIPPRLAQALSSSNLLMMGYHLRDWDFRVLFRLILNYRHGDKKGVFIQVKPKNEREELSNYLKLYFNTKQFELEWKSSEQFIQEVWDVWERDQT